MTYKVTNSGKAGVNKNGNFWLVKGSYKGTAITLRMFPHTKKGLVAAIADRTTFEKDPET